MSWPFNPLIMFLLFLTSVVEQLSRATVHRGGDTGKTITEVANRLEACMTMQRIMRHARFHYYYVIQYINIQKIRIPPPQGPHGFLLRMLSETGAES
jgi:hypothetical protein